ncbi:unnamed protein product [Cuscuta epithymum]|uniref:Uncharacterized protein n=1 Tax=Cuscuta epithymum TaxID=186058 RepID=A0AAV0EVP6_9ASTE|nr:unnamed protein product [Cuscuta epithymum]
MRCKKHFSDLSSADGVCASCLREKLFTLVAAQSSHIQQQKFQAPEDRRTSDVVIQPPLFFPRSVSPYISRRNSDTSPWHLHPRHEQRFYFTPQIGPNGKIDEGDEYSKKKRNYGFSMLYNLFNLRSKPDSDPVASGHGEPCAVNSSSASWISSIFSGLRKKQHRTFSLDESAAGGKRRSCRNFNRGMSPERYSDDFGDEHCHGGSSGYSSESPQRWKQTPRRRTVAPTPSRRSGGRPKVARSISGMTFCLSPLVRPSPNRQWNQKGMPLDMVFSGDLRAPVKSPVMLCKNGSKKIADFGRVNRNHRFCNN